MIAEVPDNFNTRHLHGECGEVALHAWCDRKGSGRRIHACRKLNIRHFLRTHQSICDRYAFFQYRVSCMMVIYSWEAHLSTTSDDPLHIVKPVKLGNDLLECTSVDIQLDSDSGGTMYAALISCSRSSL